MGHFHFRLEFPNYEKLRANSRTPDGNSKPQSIHVHERETQNRSDGMLNLPETFRNGRAVQAAHHGRASAAAG